MKKPTSARPTGPKALDGSADAKKQAAVILEVLAGAKTTTEGSQALGVSLPRYYVLETRALQGILLALEPRPRGKRVSQAAELDHVKQDKTRLEREVTRLQALLRASQRSIGIVEPKPNPGRKIGRTGRRTRRGTARALRAVSALRTGETPTTHPAETTESRPETKAPPAGA
ncbi:MAG TPA: hypothetical protein VMS04_12665 [Vicinamibacterales bacterium]|jgi:hypothetical protein|nr:hypothetical protein [Vicinamibacterales bacterium]